MKLDEPFKSTALSQINWERKREGNFYGNDPLLQTQARLRNDEPLTPQDIQLLKDATLNSIKHLLDYEYGPMIAGDYHREQALTPLFEFYPQLLER